MIDSSATMSSITIGLDVGDKKTHLCAVDSSREVIARCSFSTAQGTLLESLAKFPGAKVIFEAGSQSPWMSRVIRENGYDVQVADPRRVQLISKDPRKTDRRDAELLAKMGSAMPDLLGNIYHRNEQAQGHLSIIRARDLMVRARGMAVQQARSICKAFGTRLPSASTSAFSKRTKSLIPDVLHPALLPVLELIENLTTQIRLLEKTLATIATNYYRDVERLRQVNGVGAMISVAFVLSIEDPHRFASSRSIGSWLGLCPRSHASGDSNPQLRISKAGDPHLRRLLVQGAHYILGPFGKDSDLRRYGLHLAARGGKAAKKRAAVAVARKLAVLLHKLWITGADYEPLRNSRNSAVETA